MVAAAGPVVLFTLIWGGVAGSGYWVPRGPHRTLIQVGWLLVVGWWVGRSPSQVCLALTGACCWLFWLCCYMAQMNPLVGPILEPKALAAIHYHWGNFSELPPEEE